MGHAASCWVGCWFHRASLCGGRIGLQAVGDDLALGGLGFGPNLSRLGAFGQCWGPCGTWRSSNCWSGTFHLDHRQHCPKATANMQSNMMLVAKVGCWEWGQHGLICLNPWLYYCRTWPALASIESRVYRLSETINQQGRHFECWCCFQTAHIAIGSFWHILCCSQSCQSGAFFLQNRHFLSQLLTIFHSQCPNRLDSSYLIFPLNSAEHNSKTNWDIPDLSACKPHILDRSF